MAVFVAGDALGETIIWGAPPLGNKYKPVARLSGLLGLTAIQALDYSYSEDVLYIGDEKGCLRAFNMSGPAK